MGFVGGAVAGILTAFPQPWSWGGWFGLARHHRQVAWQLPCAMTATVKRPSITFLVTAQA